MDRVLLIWEEVPEHTKMYLIPVNVAESYKQHLEEAHNKFINSNEMNDGMRFLNMALLDEDENVADDEDFREHQGCFAEYEVDVDEPITGYNIVAVYLSGFML